MTNIFNSIAKRLSFPLFLTALLCAANIGHAQTMIVGQILMPPRNFEIGLGDTVTPTVRIHNDGTGSVSGNKIYFIIRNAVTSITYDDSLVLPSIAPGDSADLTFIPYATDPNKIADLGTFNACLITGDTTCEFIFGIRRTAVPFFDPSDNYSKTAPGDIPDQTLWVSDGATVVDGENLTWDPPPPRYPGVGVGPDSMVGPVIRLDRLDVNGNFYTGKDVGDTLTSFPINLQGVQEFTFTFDYMRGGRHHYPLGWDKDTMFGPESTTLNVNNGQLVRAGDSLILEFRNPSQPALNVASNGWNEIAAIDGGRDFEYKTFFARIDSGSFTTTVNGITSKDTGTPNYLTADFRFRFRLKAKSDVPISTSTVDDADQWYIDNPSLDGDIGIPMIEINWVRVVSPYTKVPLSQAVFPIYAHLVNYGAENGFVPPFYLKIVNALGDTVYSDSTELADINDGEDTILQFPDWDASGEMGETGAPFTAWVSLSNPNFSSNSELAMTYTKFYLNTETSAGGTSEFALDDAGMEPGVGAGNDIPTLLGIRGEGIGFNNSSGSFAMKFQLVRPDTFFGVRAYFGSANAAPDYIRISLMNDNANSNTPLDTLEQRGFASTMLAERGPNFDEFSAYLYPTPIPLQPGTYWVSVSQLGVSNMELGGCTARGGAEVTETDPFLISPDINAIYGPPSPNSPWYGTQWGSGPDDNNGNVSTSFAIEATAGSGGWAPVMPASGWSPENSNVGLPWTEILAITLNPPNPLIGAGFYNPMIRPLIGRGSTSIVQATQVPQSLTLEANFPNPFDPITASTTIAYTLDAQGPASLIICNVLGAVVKTLVNADESSGTHVISWDGRGENGAMVPAGTYLVTLMSDGRRATSKIIVTE